MRTILAISSINDDDDDTRKQVVSQDEDGSADQGVVGFQEETGDNVVDPGRIRRPPLFVRHKKAPDVARDVRKS